MAATFQVQGQGGNYPSSDQVWSPHLHFKSLTDLPLRESRNVRNSAGIAPHRLHGGNAGTAGTAASLSSRSLTSRSSKSSH